MKKLWKDNKDKAYSNVQWKRDSEKLKHLSEKIEKANLNDELVKYVRSKKKAAKVHVTVKESIKVKQPHRKSVFDDNTPKIQTPLEQLKLKRKEIVDSRQVNI